MEASKNVGEKKKMNRRRKSWCGHYQALPYIICESSSHTVTFCQTSAALSWGSLSPLDSSFGIMQWWQMGRREVRCVCRAASNHIWWILFFFLSPPCLLWLKSVSNKTQNLSVKTKIIIFITWWNTKKPNKDWAYHYFLNSNGEQRGGKKILFQVNFHMKKDGAEII